MGSIVDESGFNQGFKKTKAWWIRSRRRWDKVVSEMTVSDKSFRVLEIGCSTGEMSDYIANNKKAFVTGVDISDKFISVAKKKYKRDNLEFKVLDFNNVNYDEIDKFDYIIGDGILHHLHDNINESLKSIYNLLNDNGKIIFWEPNIYNPYVFAIFRIKYLRKVAKLEPDEMAFSGLFIRKKCMSANFVNPKVTWLDFLLPNTPERLISVLIFVGKLLEKLPFIKKVSQSIFIVAQK